MYWICRDKKIEYGEKTLIMGIVNVTPDSFSDGGAHFSGESAVKHALELIDDGADIIDLGAQSTRPGYTEITPAEEWSRLKGIIGAIREKTDAPISVDTYFPFVAEKALSEGADIINDVGGVFSPDTAELVKQSGAGWILTYTGAGGSDGAKEFFNKIITDCINFGIEKERLCVDTGIGFNKSYEQCLELIANQKRCRIDGLPLLIGVSRKRVIGRASGEAEPSKRVFGNVAADTAAVFGGADIIRIHDIKNEIKGIRTAEEIKKWIR